MSHADWRAPGAHPSICRDFDADRGNLPRGVLPEWTVTPIVTAEQVAALAALDAPDTLVLLAGPSGRLLVRALDGHAWTITPSGSVQPSRWTDA